MKGIERMEIEKKRSVGWGNIESEIERKKIEEEDKGKIIRDKVLGIIVREDVEEENEDIEWENGKKIEGGLMEIIVEEEEVDEGIVVKK